MSERWTIYGGKTYHNKDGSTSYTPAFVEPEPPEGIEVKVIPIEGYKNIERREEERFALAVTLSNEHLLGGPGSKEYELADKLLAALDVLGKTDTCPECGYPWPDERVMEG